MESKFIIQMENKKTSITNIRVRAFNYLFLFITMISQITNTLKLAKGLHYLHIK